MRSLLLLSLASMCCLANGAAAQIGSSSPVAASRDFETRANELPGLLRGEIAFEAYFTPGFRQNIPQERFTAITAQLSAGLGKPVAVAEIEMISPWRGQVNVQYERAVVQFSITVDEAAPHQITALRVLGVGAAEGSIDAIIASLAKLPGNTNFALAKLGVGEPEFIAGKEGDRALAIGSEFKLVVLAELVRGIAAGERHWDDLIAIDGKALPPGGYAEKPAGTRVSLRELATQMISISDNSATDILIDALGRRKIEAMLPIVGIARPAGMRPLLKTLDASKLKSLQADGKIDWRKQDEAARRKLLDRDTNKTDVLMLRPDPTAARIPRSIESIEWFASSQDMVRVMDWLRRNTERGPAAEARSIMSKASGISPVIAAKWRFVGFKGGSEPGVFAMTYLLQAKDGSWWAASATWNDPAKEVDNVRFAGLVGRAIELSVPKL